MKRERAVRIAAAAGCLFALGLGSMGCGSKDETDAKPTTANAGNAAPAAGAEGGPVLTNGPLKEGASAGAAPVSNDAQSVPRAK